MHFKNVSKNIPHVTPSPTYLEAPSLPEPTTALMLKNSNTHAQDSKNERYPIISDTIFFVLRRGQTVLCTTDAIAFIKIILISELYEFKSLFQRVRPVNTRYPTMMVLFKRGLVCTFSLSRLRHLHPIV